MRYSVSDTAEYGDYTARPAHRDRGDQAGDAADPRRDPERPVREALGGRERGRPARGSTRTRKAERSQQLEQVGAQLRAMMPFLDAVEVTAEGEVKRGRGQAGRSRTMSDRITIFDTTLRDGEQSPGCSMHTGREGAAGAPARAARASTSSRRGFPIASAGRVRGRAGRSPRRSGAPRSRRSAAAKEADIEAAGKALAGARAAR